MTIYNIRKSEELSPLNSVFRLQGFSGVATGSTTTDIDFMFPEERWLTGGQIVVNAGHWGDTATIQVVDKDNVMGYGANLVLREFVKDFIISTDSNSQISINVSYVSLIPAGIYIRIKYTNSNAADCSIGCNLFTHIPTA